MVKEGGHEEKEQQQEKLSHQQKFSATSGADPPSNGAPFFSEFSLSDLKAATNDFSADNIVSESGEKAPNIVYKGRLQNRQRIAVKKFTKMAWPDPKQFVVLLMLLHIDVVVVVMVLVFLVVL